MGATTVWQGLARPPWRFLPGRWPWLSLAYLLSSAVIGVVLLVLSLATLLLLPLWGLLVGAWERRRTRMLGFPRQPSGHTVVDRDERHHWLNIRLTEAATWRETGALLLDLVLGWAMLAVLFLETMALVIPIGVAVVAQQRDATITLFGDTTIVARADDWWKSALIAVVMLAVFAYLNALLAAGQASLLRLICGPRPQELERNLEKLTRSRAALVAGFEAERRRIERDLHDGVQQELVILATRLGMLDLELDELAEAGSDTRGARGSLAAAQDQAERAMATLRDTVRGIHPAVLGDHGLRAALVELAGRTPFTVELDLADLPRLPAAVETAGYYLVTEALTNAAKHAGAGRVLVRSRYDSDVFALLVSDDGRGGADMEAGTGLRGLRERAETLGGTLEVDSPEGGPTVVRMSLPVAEERIDRHAPATR